MFLKSYFKYNFIVSFNQNESESNNSLILNVRPN